MRRRKRQVKRKDVVKLRRKQRQRKRHEKAGEQQQPTKQLHREEERGKVRCADGRQGTGLPVDSAVAAGG